MLSKRLYKLLVTKFSAFDTKLSSTSGLVTKTKFDSDKEGLQKKIENVYKKIRSTSGLVTTQKLQIENKIPSVTGTLLLLLLSMQKPQKLKIKYLITLTLSLLLSSVD